MSKRSIFDIGIIAIYGDINDLTFLIVRNITFSRMGQRIILELTKKLLFRKSTLCSDFTSRELTNIRERLILLSFSIKVQEEVIVVDTDRDRIDLNRLKSIMKTLRNDTSIFGRIGFRSVHDRHVNAIPIVHGIIIRTRLLNHSSLRNFITNFETIHIVVIVLIAEDFGQRFRIATAPCLIIFFLFIVDEKGIRCRMVDDIFILYHLIHDFVVPFCLLIASRITTDNIFAIGKYCRKIRVQQVYDLAFMRSKHDRSHGGIVLGHSQHRHADKTIRALQLFIGLKQHFLIGILYIFCHCKTSRFYFDAIVRSRFQTTTHEGITYHFSIALIFYAHYLKRIQRYRI